MKRNIVFPLLAAALTFPRAALADTPPPAADKAPPPPATAAANKDTSPPADKAPPPLAAADKAPPPPAQAASPASNKDAAPAPSRVLFDAGAKAYSIGNYRAAIQAFEQAYAIDARPGLLFSIAQAHRRLYRVNSRPGHVVAAIRRYKEYLAQAPSGARQAEAQTALDELLPIVQKLEQEGQLQTASAMESDRATRLMVTSSAPGAAVLLDAETTPRPTPLITELPPGPHTIRVTAQNHVDETRQVEVAAGAITALDLPLREKPATLLVTSVAGARVTLDGRLVGEAPLAGPLELPSGQHDLRVQRPGYTSYSNRFLVGPGARLTLDAPLAMTLQRKVSFGLLTGGGAAIAAGVVLGGVSLAQQADAAGVKARMDRGEVVCRGQDCPDLDRYNSAVAARDTLRTGAFTLAGIGTVAAGAGLLYYLLDGVWPFAGPQDSAAPAPLSPSGRPETPRPRLLGAPVIAPDFGGLAISGQF